MACIHDRCGAVASVPVHSNARNEVASREREQRIPGTLREGGSRNSCQYRRRIGIEQLRDNERPAHVVDVPPYWIDTFPVTNAQYQQFINDGGYKDFRWWHSAGWEQVNTEHWQAPLYWELHNDEWMIRDFAGLHRAIDKADEPVSHVSFLESSAYAKWAGKRLPTEAEWEKAATFSPSLNSKQDFPWGNVEPDGSKANLFQFFRFVGL